MMQISRSLYKLSFIVCLVLSFDSQADDYERGFEALASEDYQKAAYYLSFFASNGDARAQYNMGVMYRDGLGVERDAKAALTWFLYAAAQDHMLSNYAIGLLMRDGPTEVQNPERALHYLGEAAFLGHALAPLEIGNMYFAGTHVAKDRTLAFVWWSLSAERHGPGAEANVTMLTNSLTVEEVSKIQNILAQCDILPLRECLAEALQYFEPANVDDEIVSIPKRNVLISSNKKWRFFLTGA